MHRPARARGQLAWISLLSSAIVGAYLVGTHGYEPEGAARADLHVRFALSLGYGHLLASVIGTRRRRPQISGRRLAAPVALLLAYGLYTHACHMWSGLPVVLLGLSAWHTFENDRAIRRARLTGRGTLDPLSRSPREHAADVARAAIASGLVFAIPLCWPRVSPADVIAAFTLHHLFGWLVFAVARGYAQGKLRSTLGRLAWLHAPALGACAIAAHVLTRADLEPLPFAPIARLCLDPSTYLFWSAAHVVHTAWRRAPGARR
jgi:hypothetical protein